MARWEAYSKKSPLRLPILSLVHPLWKCIERDFFANLVVISSRLLIGRGYRAQATDVLGCISNWEGGEMTKGRDRGHRVVVAHFVKTITRLGQV